MMTMPGFKASNAAPPTPRTGMEAADAGSDAVDPFEKPIVAAPSDFDSTTAFFQSG